MGYISLLPKMHVYTYLFTKEEYITVKLTSTSTDTETNVSRLINKFFQVAIFRQCSLSVRVKADCQT